MSTISVFGGTGYAGGSIVREAVRRGHHVRIISRSAPAAAQQTGQEGVEHLRGSITDPDVRAAALAGADVVVSAVAPRGETEARLVAALDGLAKDAAEAGVRLGVVGGAGSLLVAPGGPRLEETPQFPAEARAEAQVMAEVLEHLRASDERLDWFLVSPALLFGDFAPGETLGRYRTGGDVMLTADHGPSEISGTDFALAFVDEIEHPTHRRTRFGVAH